MNENLELTLRRLVEQTPDSPPTKRPVKIGERTVRAFNSQLRSIDEKARTIEFVASTEATDRYGDVIRVAGWKYDNYLKNPIFLWGHRSGDPPIGRTIDLRIESNPPALVQKVQFADKETYPFADTIFQLYKKGFMRAVSVGFMPLEEPKCIQDEDGRMTGYEFLSQDLLELSAVPIPANQEALARSFVPDADVRKVFRNEEDAPATAAEWLVARKKLYLTVGSIERLVAEFDRQFLGQGKREAQPSQQSEEITDVDSLLGAIVGK